MNDTVELKRANGETFNAEVICYFELANMKKRYIFYTLNEMVENGLVKIYASEVGDAASLSGEMTDEEWNNLKSVMKAILTDKSDENIKFLKWEA